AFLPRHLQQFLNRLIEIAGQLLLPFGDLCVARVLHRLRGLLHLRGGVARLVLHLSALLPRLALLSATLLAALAACAAGLPSGLRLIARLTLRALLAVGALLAVRALLRLSALLARGLFHPFSRRFAVLARFVGALGSGLRLLSCEPVLEL